MSRTTKHPPKPDRFTKKHRTGGHQARSKRVLATLRYLRIEHLMPDYILTGIKRRAGEDCASSPNVPALAQTGRRKTTTKEEATK